MKDEILRQAIKDLQPNEALAITPDDNNDLPTVGTLFIGTGGDLKVDLEKSTGIIYKNLPDGCNFPRKVKKVYATDTTASNIILERRS